MKWKWFLVSLPVVLLLGGLAGWLLFFQGETTREVVTRHQVKLEARRKRLSQVADELPPPGSVLTNVRKRLDPPPFYDPDHRKEINCSIVMEEQLRMPDDAIRTPEKVDFNLFEGQLLVYLQWSGPKNPMSSTVWEGRARTGMEDELRRVLDQPYLVVIRTVRYERPMLIGEASFRGGFLDMEALVYDWRVNRMEAAVRVTARAEQNVSVVKGKDLDWIYSSMLGNARKELALALTETTGGTFDFDYGTRR